MNKNVYIILACFILSSCNVKQEEKGVTDLLQIVPVLAEEDIPEDYSELLLEIGKSNDSIELIYGVHFGECNGYCNTELRITSQGVKHTTSTRDMNSSISKSPPIIRVVPYSKSEWEVLIDKIDLDLFYNLEESIGCPDCNDGGAESIRIGANGKFKIVTIEHGASIEGLNDLLEAIRELNLN